MNKVIILEGPDCSGKDTFIEMYCKKHNINNYVIFKNGLYPSPQEAYESYRNQFLYCHKLLSSYYVFINRTFISDIIYGDVCRNGNRISDSMCFGLGGYMRNLQTKVVFMIRNETIIDCWKEKQSKGIEYVKSLETFKKIIEKYDEFSIDPKYNAFISGSEFLITEIHLRTIHDLEKL